MKTTFLFLLTAVGLALLVGCFGGKAAQREALAQKRTFVPLAAAANPAAPPPGVAAVQVRPFRALPPFDARTFIVRRPGGEFAADYYNGWLAVPHELIRAQAARYLEAAGLFAAVYDGSSGTVAPLGLEGVVSELYLDTTGDEPAAVVTLRLLVLDERSPAFTVLYTREESARVPFEPSSATAASQAFGQAVTQTLEAQAAALVQAPLPK
jgi:ABC-type uncharacterized transport system auxiliary subunit